MLFVLAFVFMLPGLAPGRVAAPVDQLLVYAPWNYYYPDVNPPFHGGDPLRQQLPWREWAEQEWQAGRFPLWASGPMGGMPMFANMQVAVLYPLHLLWALLGVEAGLGIIIVLKIWLAGLGMWALLRAMNIHPVAALVSSMGMMFSAWFVNWLPWQNSGIYLLLPWMAWAVYAWCRNGSRWALVVLAVAVACAALAGHPEILFIVGVTVGIWAAGLLVTSPLRTWVRQASGLAIAVALGFAIGAIQLLPFFSVLGLTHQAAARANAAFLAGAHLDPVTMANWVLPRFWGYIPDVVVSDFNFTESNGYIGLVALLGIVLCVIAAVRRRLVFRLVVPWVVVGVVAWVLAYDGTVGRYIRMLPGFSQAINVRWIGMLGFSGLVVSAFGWDWLARRVSERTASLKTMATKSSRVWAGLGLALVAVGAAVLLAHALGVFPIPTHMPKNGAWFKVSDPYRAYWAYWAVGLALAAIGATVLWASGRLRWVAPAILSVVLLVDLWALMLPVNGSAPASEYFPNTSFLQQVERLVPPTDRILVQGDVLPTDTSLVFDIRDWRSQDPMMSERAFQAAATLAPKMPSNIYTQYNMILDNPRLRIAPMLGMRYFILPAGTNPNTPGKSDPARPEFTRLAYKEGLGLWAAEGVPGFAYLSDNVTVEPGEAAAKTWLQNVTWEEDRAYEAMVEAPPAAVASVKHDPAGTSPGRTSVEEYTPGHIVVKTDAVRPALLVVAESLYPGWRATIDGQPVEVLRANYLSQGVVVPAGRHTVEFQYQPGAMTYGMLISALGIVGLLVLSLWAWRPRRPLAPESASTPAPLEV